MNELPPVLTDTQDGDLAILAARTTVATVRYALAEAEARAAQVRFELATAEAQVASLELTRQREALAEEINTREWRYDFDAGTFTRKGS